MKTLFTLLVTLVSFSIHAQVGNNTIAYIGEMRYKNKRPVYYNNFDYRFNYRENFYDTLDVVISPKEEYYPDFKGTEVIFYIKRKFVTDTKNKTLFINGVFYVTLDNNQKKIKAEMKNIPINFSAAKKINDNTFKLDGALVINEPELFSLPMMLNHINEQLDYISSRKNGFSNVIDNLEKFVDNYADGKKISYNTLIDFYKLLVFLEDYVPENSFFNEEARNLNERISTIKSQLVDTTGKNFPTIDNKDLLEELINSIEVYDEYQKVFARINDYYSRLKLILFLKAR